MLRVDAVLRAAAYLFETADDLQHLPVGQDGLLVDLDLTADLRLRPVHQLQAERAVQGVLVPTPDVSEWNLLQHTNNTI